MLQEVWGPSWDKFPSSMVAGLLDCWIAGLLALLRLCLLLLLHTASDHHVAVGGCICGCMARDGLLHVCAGHCDRK